MLSARRGGAIYNGSVYQRGHGLGSFLKGLFCTVAPLFKSGVKTLGREAQRIYDRGSGGWCREGARALPPQFKMGKTGETNIINFLKEMYYCFVWILYTDVPM
jgi:hypothetical protein